MEIINYTQRYEDQVVDLWNNSCSFDSISVSKFRKQALFDVNFDPDLCWLALEGDSVIGFIMGTKRKFPYMERGLEPEKGWVNVLFVDKLYWRKGIGQALYNNLEKSFIELGVKHIILGAYSPNYFFWGIDPENYPNAISFFEKNGFYNLDKHYSMYKDLHGFTIPESSIEKREKAEELGYKFINFDYIFSLDLLKFVRDQFGGGWKRNALILMQTERAEDCILLVLDKDNKICGVCMREIDGNPMRFGPIGVDKTIRNLGLGSILLDMQCYEMAKRGIYHMYFVTTDEAGKRYYERNNLKVFRTFIEYRKDL